MLCGILPYYLQFGNTFDLIIQVYFDFYQITNGFPQIEVL
ncbi:hypothetical protein ABH942_002327 [Flavobacterium sp. 28YEA47A]